MKTYFVYIIQCKDNSFYVGITTDLNRRIRQHNGIINGGAKYTRMKKPVVLRYYEVSSDRSKALKREYYLRNLSHAEKSKLCDSFTCINP